MLTNKSELGCEGELAGGKVTWKEEYSVRGASTKTVRARVPGCASRGGDQPGWWAQPRGGNKHRLSPETRSSPLQS